MDLLQPIERHYPPGTLSHRVMVPHASEVAELAEAVAVCAWREQTVDRPFGTPPR